MNRENLNYQKYARYNRNEIINKMKKILNSSRLDHCLRVEKTAIELAKENDFDEEVAGLAGLVHDYAKQRSNEDFKKIINNYHLDPDLLNYGNAIWHGYVGYLLVQNELGIEDKRILDAVKYHTIAAPYMGICAQIIYMSDYIEPGRDFPGVEEARKITHQDLWQGVKYQNQHTMEYLIANKSAIYPKAIEAYNSIVADLN